MHRHVPQLSALAIIKYNDSNYATHYHKFSLWFLALKDTSQTEKYVVNVVVGLDLFRLLCMI